MNSPAADLRPLLRTGLARSLVSLLIKVATAGLTYGMYVVLSRIMGATEYGYFAFGLSLATVLAIAAAMGQQTAILRYWAEEQVAGRHEGAVKALRSGGALTIICAVAISGVLVVGSALLGVVAGQPVAHLVACAALVLPMALAEYWSSALRAQGSVWTALSPRDILWRLLAPISALALFALGVSLAGWQALLLLAGLLGLTLALQYVEARRRRYEIAPGSAGLRQYWRERGRASRWFLFGTLIDSASLNADIIFIGLLVTAEQAGVYFNAFRTAGLLTLFTYAISLVAAPMIAHHYHAGEMRQAQAITALSAWAGFLFSVAVFIGFVVFGADVLSLFGPHAAAGYPVLLLLGIGLIFDAATGPSRMVMMMTGHERDYVRIFGGLMLAGLLLELLVIPLWGVVGAAAVNAGSRAVAAVAIAWWSRRRIGIDTSLLGVLLVNRLPSARSSSELARQT